MRRRASITNLSIFGSLLLLFSATLGEDIPAPAAVVPYDSSRPLAEQQPERYYLDYDTFQGMWDAVKTYREKRDLIRDPDPVEAPDDFVLSTALYRISMSDDRLQVKGRLVLTTRGKKWQNVPLPFSGINLSEIDLNGEPASYRDGSVLIEEAGQHRIELSFEIARPDSSSTDFSWKVPPAAATLLQITMESDVAEPVLQENLPLSRSRLPDGGPTIYTAALGNRTEISLRSRLRTRGRDMTRPNVANIEARLFVAEALERLEATYRLEFEGQEDDQFTISFDPSLKPVRLDIPNLSSLEVAERNSEGLKALTFTLTEPVADQMTVGFAAERLTTDNEREFPRLSADASRLVQQRSILRVNDLAVKTWPGSNHRQVVFPMKAERAGFVPVATFSLAGSEEALAYSAVSVDPERSAAISFVYQVEAEKLETVGRFDIRSPNHPLTSSSFLLPSDSTIQLVEGNRIRDWWLSGDELFIRFAGATPEVTRVLIHLTRQSEEEEEEIVLAPIQPVGISEDGISGEGVIVGHVTDDVSLTLSPDRNIVREVGIDEVAADFEVIAPLERKRGFRFDQINFDGRIRLSEIVPDYLALWVMLARVHEGHVDISFRTDIEVSRGGLDRVTFTTPEALPELVALGDEVRELRHDLIDGVRQYEVVFQSYLTDAVAFTLETEIPHAGAVGIPGLSFDEASRQERFLIVENQSNGRLSLESVGVREEVNSSIPFLPSRLLQSASLFKANPGWSLNTRLERLQTTSGSDAVILYADLTSSLRSNGEEWLKAVYHIQNRSLQFLPVVPPPGSELVSAKVDGTEIRSDQGEVDGNACLLIPLIQTELGQLAYDVELVFRSASPKNGNKALSSYQSLEQIDRRLDDPRVLGTTVEQTFWQVYLPAGFEIDKVGGNMKQVASNERLLALVQSDIDELIAMNQIGADFDNAGEVRLNSIDNSGVLVQRIESNLANLDQQSGFVSAEELSKAREKLEQQKVVITENRIEIPKQHAGTIDIDLLASLPREVAWLDNGAALIGRNVRIESEKMAQVERIDSQTRLNDNLATGTIPVGGELGDGVNQQDEANSYSLFDSLKQKGETTEVDSKLNALNFAQIGHAGASVENEVENTPPDPTQAPINYFNARTSNIAGQRTKADAISGRFSDVANVYPNGISLSIGPDPFSSAVPERAAGRRSLAVDFPVEGEPLHFEKLKDYAEVQIVASKPGDTKRLKWLLLFIASLTALWGASYWGTLRRSRN